MARRTIGDKPKGEKDDRILDLTGRERHRIRLLENEVEEWRQYTIRLRNDDEADTVRFIVARRGDILSRKGFRATQRSAVNVWSYDEKAIKILVGGKKIFSQFDDWREMGLDPLASDVLIHRSGSKRTTEYSVTRMDTSPFDQEWSPDDLHDLSKFDQAPTDEQTLKILEEMEIDYDSLRLRVFTLEQAREFEMPFGKYKGQLVGDLYDEGNDYLDWFTQNSEDQGRIGDDVYIAIKTVQMGGDYDPNADLPPAPTPEPKKASGNGTKPPPAASDDEEEEEEWSPEADEENEPDPLANMSRADLKKFIKEQGLEVKVFKSDSDDDLRVKIADAMKPADEPEAEEEEEDDEPEAPAEPEAETPADDEDEEDEPEIAVPPELVKGATAFDNWLKKEGHTRLDKCEKNSDSKWDASLKDGAAVEGADTRREALEALYRYVIGEYYKGSAPGAGSDDPPKADGKSNGASSGATDTGEDTEDIREQVKAMLTDDAWGDFRKVMQLLEKHTNPTKVNLHECSREELLAIREEAKAAIS